MTRTTSPPTNGNETINIHLNKAESTDNDEGTTTAYIISQNRKIAHENRLLIIEKVALEKELDEKDDEMGRTEKSNVHLKGLLKNFKELSELHNKISVSNELMLKESQSDINDFLEEVKQIIHICTIGYVVYILLMFFVMSWCTFIITNISIAPCMASLFYLTSFKASSNKVILDQIRQNKKNIKEIEESLDFINEYIDSI